MNQLSLSVRNPVQPHRLQDLLSAAGQGPVLITTHDSPDPDALAAGLALATLLRKSRNISSRLVYTGLVGRAENRAVLRLLTPEWEYLDSAINVDGCSAVAIVDSQPGAGNNSLPAGLIPEIVIDHHSPLRPETLQAAFQDVRTNIGSTASMLYEYLAAANILPDPRLATAMFYGLRSDTNGLARDTTPADGVIYSLLQSALDRNLLHQVILNGLSQEYFYSFDYGLKNAKIAGRTITTFLGTIHRPDLVAEMADLLVRLENVDTALCLGCFGSVIYLSLRTGTPHEDAGLLVQQLIAGYGKAGGHGTIAGGQVPVEGLDVEQIVEKLTLRFLSVMGEAGPGSPLIGNRNGREE